MKYYINYELDTPEGFQPGDCWDCPLHYIKDFNDEPEVCCVFDKCPIEEYEDENPIPPNCGPGYKPKEKI